MSNPRNETYDLAGECNSIFDEYDVITREQGDAVYDDGTEDEFQINMCEECADYMWEVNFNPEIMVDHFNIGENDE